MRESIGGSFLFNLVIIFSAIVILVFVFIMSYSKAYRVKNRIIEIVERNGSYDSSINNLNEELERMGYSTNNRKNCPIVDGMANMNVTSYDYCIYRINNKSSDDSNYYVVITYAKFQFPIIGDLIRFEVKGETKILGRKYDY